MQTTYRKARRLAKYYLFRFKKLSLTKKLLLVVGVLFAVQLLIPTGTTSLLSRFDGHSTAFTRYDTVASQYREDAKQIEFEFDKTKASVPVSQLGYTIQADETLARVPRVTVKDKLIPLAAYLKLLRPANVHTSYTVDDKTHMAFIGTMSNQYSVAPTNASATVSKDLQLTISPDKPGYRYGVVELQKALEKPNLYGNTPISLKGEKAEATFKPEAFSKVQQQFDALKKTNLTVSYGGKSALQPTDVYLPRLETVIQADAPKLQFSEKGYADMLAELAKTFGVASGVGGSTAGETQSIKVDEFKSSLSAWLLAPSQAPLSLPTQPIRSSSTSTDSLQGVVTKWVQARGSGYYVYVQELGGAGRSAQYNASQQTVLASTYKLFVAWAAYKLAESGALNLATPVYNGRTIEQCLSRAIINSDNECAKAIGKYIGWAKIETMVTGAGFTNVRLNNYDATGNFAGDKTGNATELASFLRQLQTGLLLDVGHTSTLLGYMKQQVYRSGIPAGSGGSVVADKVGFLSNYTHDAAIVYGPKSTYVVVIMSDKGSNWANIKSLATVIYQNLN